MKVSTSIALFLLIASAQSNGQAQTTFWTASTVPAVAQATSDTASVTLGLRFYSDVAGSVTGVRFYKGRANTGTHVGNLWTSAGAKLAAVTFYNETASGWQQASFATPVKIQAKATYVISYTAPRGAYAHNFDFNWTPVVSGPLHASGSAAGVFRYGGAAAFPNETWRSTNYWVDVVFKPDTPTNPSPTYTISGTVTGAPAQITLSGPQSRSAATDAAGKYTFSGLSNGTYVVAASQSGYTFAPATASVNISNASVSGTNFTGTANPAPVKRSVVLSWVPSQSTTVRGYNVYRADVAGGAFAKVSATAVASTNFVDNAVVSGRMYYYVATAIDADGNESTYSNQATAVLP